MNGLPHFCTGPIVKGFGRGSKELGCPTGKMKFWILLLMIRFIYKKNFITANVPLEVVQKLPDDLKTGVYFGWASVDNGDVYKAVLSLGWNPFYENKEKSLVCDYNFFFCLFCAKKRRHTDLLLHQVMK